MDKREKQALDRMLRDMEQHGERCPRCQSYSVQVLGGAVVHCLECGNGSKKGERQ